MGSTPTTLREGASLGGFDITSLVSLKTYSLMTRETLNTFENRNNVTKITGDDGSISYLTQSSTFADETNRLGAVSLNTVENEKKHVLFLFNENEAEVGRYYLGKKLQGKTPNTLANEKATLCFFESFNPATKSWVPCVGLSSQESLAATAVHF